MEKSLSISECNEKCTKVLWVKKKIVTHLLLTYNSALSFPNKRKEKQIILITALPEVPIQLKPAT